MSVGGERKLGPPVEGGKNCMKIHPRVGVRCELVIIIEPPGDFRLNEALECSSATGDRVYIKYGHSGAALPPSLSRSMCGCALEDHRPVGRHSM